MGAIGWYRKVAVLLGIVIGATACSSDDKSGSAADPPPVQAIPQLADMSGQALPLEPYMLQPDAFGKILDARERLIIQCMRRSGFDFKFGRDASPSSGGGAARTQSQMRYVTSLEDASAYGYHSPPDGSAAVQAAAQPQYTAAEAVALRGENSDGGCFAEVDAKLAQRGVLIQDHQLVSDINAGSMKRSLQDPRLKDLFSAWSACMKERGYAYANPVEASNDPRWGATEVAGSLEKATAITDTECMTKNNGVGVWFAVESAYQKREIEANFEKLEEIRRALDTSVRVANEILVTG